LLLPLLNKYKKRKENDFSNNFNVPGDGLSNSTNVLASACSKLPKALMSADPCKENVMIKYDV
jgi:hypothetical protein